MLRQEPGKSAKQTEVEIKEVKTRHPAFSVSNEAAVAPGRTAKPQQEVIVTPAVKQLNRDGYIVYNTPEKQDIYITMQPETAFFDDEEPKMVKMAGGSFVAADRHCIPAAVCVKTEQDEKSVVCEEPADMFLNANRRKKYEEVDYNLVIIKKSDSYDAEFNKGQALFRPYTEVTEPVVEEAFRMSSVGEAAMTGSAEVKTEQKAAFIENYSDEQDYVLENAQAEKEPVTEAPAGLYVEGYREIVIAETAEEETKERSTFEGIASLKVETAVTSECEPAPEVVAQIPVDFLGLPAPKEADVDATTIVDVTSEEEPAVETVCDVIETVEEPAAETEIISGETEAEPVAETADIVEEEEPAAETATDSAETEAEPIAKTICDVVTEEEPAAEEVCDVTSKETTETVTNAPQQIEVVDETADLMKITIPCLCMCDDLMLELARDCQMTIPDDGLEAFDCVFRSKTSPAKEECSCTSSAPEKKKSAGKPDPYYNFRID